MKNTFYTTWKHNGCRFTAPKRQVKILGKEYFEQKLQNEVNELNVAYPDGVEYTLSDCKMPASEELLDYIGF